MIGSVRGILEQINEDSAIIDVQGVGFLVNIGSGTAANMPGVGEEVKLHTYMAVREDDISLFGFLGRDELELFKMLIKVSGIGPKGAQAILSVMTAKDLRFAILSGDAKSISRAPGIGGKTAQKVILELKDKIGDTIGEEGTYEGAAGSGAMTTAVMTDERTEAAEALIALGYSHSEAYSAVKAAEVGEDADANAILKAALKYL